jgi:drug/metabolite transporter (DMT)-like permease
MSEGVPFGPRRAHVAIAYLAVSLVWGSTYLAIRVAVATFPPFFLGAFRFLAAGGLLYGFLRLRGAAAPTRVQWASAAGTGALYFVVGNGFLNVAEKSVASGLASVLVATMPLWATAFARFTGERASGGEWAGIALGLTGVAIMNLGSDLRAGGIGALFATLAPVGWAAGSILSKRLPLPAGPMATAAQMLGGGAALGAVSLALGERPPASPPTSAVLSLAYLAVFGSLVGFSAYTFLLRNTRAAIATSYTYVNPVVAVALGIAFAGEKMDGTTAMGALVVLGAVLVVWRSKAAPAVPRVAVAKIGADGA